VLETELQLHDAGYRQNKDIEVRDNVDDGAHDYHRFCIIPAELAGDLGQSIAFDDGADGDANDSGGIDGDECNAEINCQAKSAVNFEKAEV
jgi:hypothetical protein